MVTILEWVYSINLHTVCITLLNQWSERVTLNGWHSLSLGSPIDNCVKRESGDKATL